MARIQAILEIRRQNITGPRTAAALINAVLREQNSYVSEIALEVLGSMRSYAKSAVGPVTQTIKNREAAPSRRARAAQILGAIGNEVPQSVPILMAILQDRQEPYPVRQAAADALTQFGRLEPRFMSGLIAVLSDTREPPNLRISGAQILGNTGRYAEAAIPRLSSILEDKTPPIMLREASAYALGAIDSDSQTNRSVESLTAVVSDSGENVDLRRSATRALGTMGQTGTAALPVLDEVLTKTQTPALLRFDILEAIQRDGQGTHASITHLTKIVRDKSESQDLRIKAAQTLRSVGPDGDTITQLAKVVTDTSETPQMRLAAIEAIDPQAPGANNVAYALRQVLSNDHVAPELRAQAANQLAPMRPLSDEDIRVFVSILRNPKDNDDVRRAVAYAAGMLGSQAADAVLPLVHILSDRQTDAVLRRQASWALMVIRRKAPGEIPVLKGVLADGSADLETRRYAAMAIEGIGTDDIETAQDVAPILQDLFMNHEADSQMRLSCASFLGQRYFHSEATIAALRKAAGTASEGAQLRQASISALGNIARNYSIGEATSTLIEILRDTRETTQLRQSVMGALSNFRDPPPAAVQALIDTLETSGDPQLQSAAANALGSVGEGSAKVAATLAAFATRADHDTGSRYAALEALGRTGRAAKPHLYLLFAALNGADTALQSASLQGFAHFADSATDGGDTEAIDDLKKASLIIRNNENLASRPDREGAYLDRIKRDIDHLQAISSARTRTAIVDFVILYWRWLILPLSWLVWIAFCAAMLALSPIRLLRISDWACKVLDATVKPFVPVSMPLSWVVLPPCLRFRPRSLDAWVEKNAGKLRQNFAKLQTVADRSTYVSLPVQIDGQIVNDLSPYNLQEQFSRNRPWITITGEGGVGKTTLACEIGKWAIAADKTHRLTNHLMLPILLEGDIPLSGSEDEDPLMATTRGHLRYLLGEEDPPSIHMLRSLLKNKRTLLILDGFSEMSDVARSKVQTADPNLWARAALVTSRSEETFEDVDQIVVKPERLQKAQLAMFVEKYLEIKKELKEFGNVEFAHDIVELQSIVGNREITALFATLYVDMLIASKRRANGNHLPRSVPELVLLYLNQINDSLAEPKKDDASLHQIAKKVARLCTRELRPKAARIDDVLDELGSSAIEDIAYLRDRLHLIQSISPGDEIRFALDPLAEYLSALSFVEGNGNERGKWREFLASVDASPGAPTSVRSFLQAVNDCYLYRKSGPPTHDFLTREIAARLQNIPAAER
jgi:HEAT repeat protein